MWYLVGIYSDKAKEILYKDEMLRNVYDFSRKYDYKSTEFDRVSILSDDPNARDVTPVYWHTTKEYSTELVDILTVIKDALGLMHDGKVIQGYELLSDFYHSVSRKVRDDEQV